MTYQEVINIMHGVTKSSIMGKEIPMKMKLPILYNINKLSEILNRWNVIYSDLVKRYASKDKEGNPIIVKDNYNIPQELFEDYNNEFKDIIECDANIADTDLQHIPLKYFDEYDEGKFDVLTLEDINSINFMIDMN